MFNNPLKLTILKDTIKNSFDFQITKNDGNLPKINDKNIHQFSLTEFGKKGKGQMSEPIEIVIIRDQLDVTRQVQI